MTHLFFVHSFATYHCSLSIIRVRKLKGDQCVFVCAREFVCPEIPDGAIQKIAHFRRSIGGMGSLMYVLRSRSKTRKADIEIEDLAKGREFHAYIPHSYYPPIQWAISHRLCEGFSYIEEGVTSYFSFGEFDRAYPPRRLPVKAEITARLIYRNRFPKVFRFFQENYRNVYGFTEESFPNWKRKITVGISELVDSSIQRVEGCSPILVFDAMVELGMLQSDALRRGLTKFFSDLSSSGLGELRYKLHPGQREESKDVVDRAVGAFSGKIKFRRLDRDSSLEDIFAKENCEVFVFNSAAGLYASLAGLNVFSINSYVAPFDPGYSAAVDQLPKIYREIVKDPSDSAALN